METIIRKERTAEPPYSLHDAYLMELVPEGDSVRLCFQGGYLRVEDAHRRGVTAISLEATAMGRPLYEKFGFVPMEHEMELPE